MWDQKEIKNQVEEWISSGLIEQEFGYADLHIMSATDKVIVADNGSSCLIVDTGASSNEALGQLTIMLSVRENVAWIASAFSEEHRKAISWLEDQGRVWINTGRYDILFEEPPQRDEHP